MDNTSPAAGDPNPAAGRSAPERRTRMLGILLAAAPVVALLAVFVRAATNTPVPDDYISLMPFLCDWITHPSLAEHWRLLTEQFIGHRIIFTHTAALVDFALFGQLNLVGLQVAGWVAWFGLVAGFAWAVPAVRQRPWMALAITLLLCHPEGTANTLGAIGMGNMWVIAFAFASLAAALSQGRGGMIAGLLLAAMAASAFANGLLVLPTAVFALCVQRRWPRAAVYAGAGLIVWTWYLHGYAISMGTFSLVEFVRKAAIMAGGPAILLRAPNVAALIAGFVLLATGAALLCVPRFWKAMPLHASFLVFAMLTIFMAARGRTGWDDYYMLQDRYRVYGLLLLASLYAGLTGIMPARIRTVGIAGIAVGTGYCLLSYATFLATTMTAQRLYMATALNAQFGQCFPCTSSKDFPVACASLERAATLNVYHLPQFLDAEDVSFIRSLGDGRTPVTETFILEQNDAIQGHMVIPPEKSAAGLPLTPPDLAVLADPGRIVILPVDIFRARLGEMLPRLSFFGSHFGLRLPSPIYKPGRATIFGLVRGADGRLAVAYAGSLLMP